MRGGEEREGDGRGWEGMRGERRGESRGGGEGRRGRRSDGFGRSKCKQVMRRDGEEEGSGVGCETPLSLL